MIVYNQRGYSLLLHAGGSVLLATLPHAIVASGMNVGIWKGLEVLEFDYIEAFPNPAVYSPFSLGLAFLLVFRSSQAYQRYVEAVSHCFEIRSQLSNAMMQLHAYTTVREDTRDFHRRHRRLTYAFQRAAMQELRGEHDLAKLVNLASLLPEEAELLEPSTNRPLALMHWMVVSVSERWETGGFRCAPPVIARVFTNYNDCMNAYNRARKVARTPFPFPYAQLTMAFLLIGQITIPALFVFFVRDQPTSAILAGVATWMYFAMHQVAVELEDPYGYDWNDLPLNWYSAEVLDDIQAVHGKYGAFMPWHEPGTKELHASAEHGSETEDDQEEGEGDVEQIPHSVGRARLASTVFAGGKDAATTARRSKSVWDQHDRRATELTGVSSKLSKTRRADPTRVDVRQAVSDNESMHHQRRAALPAKMDDVARLVEVERLLRQREVRNPQYLH